MFKFPYFLSLVIKIAYLFVHDSGREVKGMFYTYIRLLILLQPHLVLSPFPYLLDNFLIKFFPY